MIVSKEVRVAQLQARLAKLAENYAENVGIIGKIKRELANLAK